MNLLENVTIILVDTRTPANIGATARVMMNTGLSRLALVRPPKDARQEARKLAAGADAILDHAVVAASLAEAIADQGLVIGASRHSGRLRRNVRPPREMAAEVVPFLPRNRVSIVFGNELNGLEREDLARCHEFVSIPASGAFPSLNLSHAVMVVAYELFLVAQAPVAPAPAPLATGRELEQFYARLRETLQAVGFLDREHPDRIMFSLRQIFGAARLSERDLRILRGILTAVHRSLPAGNKNS